MKTRRIGIAGYMGAGKTAAAGIIAASAGSAGEPAVIIDADHEAKTLMNGDAAVRDRLAIEFGGSIIRNGRLSFGELGRIAFGSRHDLRRLNAIVHPPLVKHLRGILETRDGRRIVLDAAVLPLWNLEHLFDACLWIRAPFEVRLGRLRQARTDLDAPSLRQRMRVQEECLPEPACPPWTPVGNDGSTTRLAETLSGIVCIL